MSERIRNRIVDYSSNRDEIEKWLRVKGEEKYSQFADMLYKEHIEITWKKLSDLYRYDKRLLVNNFKYISFFEEYARAIIVRSTDDSVKCYNKLQNDGNFGFLSIELYKLDKSVLLDFFDSEDKIKDLDMVNLLRRGVAHNKIILQIRDCKDIMQKFCELMPPDYRYGYKNDINKCSRDLEIPENYRIRL